MESWSFREANDLEINLHAFWGCSSRYSFIPVAEDVIMLGGSLVTTAWCVLRLRLEGRPPVTEGCYEYTE